ncbi:MAG TPA: CRISPR-associated helicase Cas3', partial [Blastocatellia bacterium]|nr:CRISPR-associated helicase Cas3' [Blastocatellia bacterium]
LPMRTLVEQTRDVTTQAINNLETANLIEKDRFGVHVLMGGAVSDEWDTDPEKECILIGTQDMLLSRALNRGYAMSRYRWPLHFGLLNNDCLWVYDEVQLMGDGLATSTQLAALREKFQTVGKSQSIWMSATLSDEWLRSVDFAPKVKDLTLLELSEADLTAKVLADRLSAYKSIQRAPDECRVPDGLAVFVKERHQNGTQTLIVVNRVNRAKETYLALQDLYHPQPKKLKKGEARNLNATAPELILIHSRFRPAERKRWKQIFEQAPAGDSPGRIIVATQVVEAGVDISSRLLVTDLAPYSSLVQRFGRCNRKGEFPEANVFLVDRPLEHKPAQEKLKDKPEDRLEEKDQAMIAAPYAWEQLQKAREIISELTSVAPQDLPDYHDEYAPTHVLRKRDIVELFDTTPDLSGFDLDVSRFVRGGEERDVSVAWRPLEGKQPARTIPALTRDELCPVPLYEFKAFLKKETLAWIWDPLAKPDEKKNAVGQWVKLTDAMLRPGISILLDAGSGAYNPEIGWDSTSKEAVSQVSPDVQDSEEAYPDDLLSERDYTQTLAAHSAEAKAKCLEILEALQDLPLTAWRENVIRATHHHDWGKAHPIFQRTLHGTPEVLAVYERLLAKSQRGGKHTRPHFRHELASALALLQTGADDLTVYLAACHHGKVRLGIRSLAGEHKPPRPESSESNTTQKKFARGVWDDDELPATDLGDGVTTEAIKLNLAPMTLGASDNGGKSWLERMIALRDEIGIFRLAFLECLIRAADVRASKYPQDFYKEVL